MTPLNPNDKVINYSGSGIVTINPTDKVTNGVQYYRYNNEPTVYQNSLFGQTTPPPATTTSTPPPLTPPPVQPAQPTTTNSGQPTQPATTQPNQQTQQTTQPNQTTPQVFSSFQKDPNSPTVYGVDASGKYTAFDTWENLLKANNNQVPKIQTVQGLSSNESLKTAPIYGQPAKTDTGTTQTNPDGTPKTTTTDAGTAPVTPEDQVKKYVDLYNKASTDLGLPTLKTNIDDTTTKYQALQNEKQDKIQNINDNPWLDENTRQKSIDSVNNRYVAKEQLLTSMLTLYNNQYTQGLNEANTIAGQVITDQRTAAENHQKALEANTKLVLDYGVDTPWYTIDGQTIIRTSDGKVEPSYEAWVKDGGGQGAKVKMTGGIMTLKEQQDWLKALLAANTKITIGGVGDSPSDLGYTNDAINLAANQYLLTGQMPALGNGSNAAVRATRSAILNRAAELAQGTIPGANKAQLTALQSSLTQQSNYLNTIERSVNTVDDNLGLLSKAADKVNSSSSPLVNEWTNLAKSKVIGSGDLAAYEAAIQTVRTEYANILARGGQVTDQNRTESRILIPDNITKAQLQQVLTTLHSEGQNVLNNARGQVDQIQGQIQGIIGNKSSGTTTDPKDPFGLKKTSFNQVGNTTASKASSLVSKNPAPYGLINGYDITNYATDPNHEKSVYIQYQTLQREKVNPGSAQSIDKYISSRVKNSPVKGVDVIKAAKEFGVDPLLMLSLMQVDSSFGTAGKAVRTRNPGNVGNTTEGGTQGFSSWLAGIRAVAQNLSKRRYTKVA